MIGLLGAESLRLRKRWMPRIIILIELGIVVLIIFAISSQKTGRTTIMPPTGIVAALVFAASLSPFLWSVLAGSWAGNEYGWGTIRLVLARNPSRIEMVLAALIALVIVVLIGFVLVLAVAAAADYIVGAIFSGTPHTTAPNLGTIIIKTLLGDWYSATFYVLIAYAAGSIFRSGAAGIGIGIGFDIASSVVAAIFRGLGGAWKTIAEHFPNAYTTALPDRLASPALHGEFGRAGANAPSVSESLLWLGLYMVILLALTFIVVTRRDVTS